MLQLISQLGGLLRPCQHTRLSGAAQQGEKPFAVRVMLVGKAAAWSHWPAAAGCRSGRSFVRRLDSCGKDVGMPCLHQTKTHGRRTWSRSSTAHRTIDRAQRLPTGHESPGFGSRGSRCWAAGGTLTRCNCLLGGLCNSAISRTGQGGHRASQFCKRVFGHHR